MKNLKLSAAMLVLLGVMLSVPGGYAQSTPPPTNSALGSPRSDTRADVGTASKRLGGATPEGQSPSAHHGGKPQEVIKACSAAVAELEASRRLIDLLERENRLLKDRLETETSTTAILAELNASRKAENETLKTALSAKSETLAAKDEVIASQQKLIDTLKAKKSSPWKRFGDILIGVAAGLVLR
ncbi:MAG: hypothetical protein ABL984_03665 [Pyrinomonadaceae bacterium]